MDTSTWRLGADLFGQTLAQHGVGQVFTLSGSHINPLLAGCADAGIALIDTRHEAAAGHAAEGFAKASAAAGVCLVTAGPGFTNVLTPMASCLVDAVPALFVAGAASAQALNPLQGGYSQTEVARPLAKAVLRAAVADQIPALTAEGLELARSGRPGPVFLEIPIEAAFGKAGFAEAAPSMPRPCIAAPDARLVADAAERIRHARQPLVLAGGGIRHAGAAGELKRFADRTGIPVLTNLNAHGALAANHPAWAGPFSALLPAAPAAAADVLLVLGARFGLLTAGLPGRCAGHDTQIIQVDIHPPELSHLRGGDIGIAADCREFLSALNGELNRTPQPDRSRWRGMVAEARARSLAAWSGQCGADRIHPFQLAREVVAALPPDAVLVADGGEAKAWIEMNAAPLRLGHYISRAYSGALGSGPGLALGAQFAHPGKRVCLFIGDGAWGFHSQEIETYRRHRLPIVTVVVNNGCWGSIRRAQQRLWNGERQLATELGYTRFDLVAQGFGCFGQHVVRPDELAPALQRALRHDGPSLVNVEVGRDPDPAAPS